MKPLVIFHANCWDGFCAAWVARKALGDIEEYPAYYGQSPPDVKDRDIFILDFSYKRPVMLDILASAKSVVVLDHHQTAEAELRDLPISYPDDLIRFDMTKSGARLTWEYFFPQPQDAAPWLVNYTEDRDLWRHALHDTHEINAALRSYPLDFDVWDGFAGLDSDLPPQSFYVEGVAIRRAERAIVDTHVCNARLIEMDGHRVKAVNATVLFSEIAGELAKGAAFGVCYFDRQDGKRQWSLRSTEDGADVSVIAQKYGGGGHKHAAGFETSEVGPLDYGD